MKIFKTLLSLTMCSALAASVFVMSASAQTTQPTSQPNHNNDGSGNMRRITLLDGANYPQSQTTSQSGSTQTNTFFFKMNYDNLGPDKPCPLKNGKKQEGTVRDHKVCDATYKITVKQTPVPGLPGNGPITALTVDELVGRLQSAFTNATPGAASSCSATSNFLKADGILKSKRIKLEFNFGIQGRVNDTSHQHVNCTLPGTTSGGQTGGGSSGGSSSGVTGGGTNTPDAPIGGGPTEGGQH